MNPNHLKRAESVVKEAVSQAQGGRDPKTLLLNGESLRIVEAAASSYSRLEEEIFKELLEKVREYTEGDGWEKFFGKKKTDTCCPGDDIADGWNAARQAIIQAARDRGVKVE